MRARGALLVVVSAAGLALVLGAAKPHQASPPPPPPPGVSLELDAPAPDRGWSVKLKNDGADPIRIVADPYLVSFDVTSQGHDHHCTLPGDMRPGSDTVRTLVVPPGRSWTARVDPSLYCFSSASDSALAPGATVTARFGFPDARYAPPYAITPIGDGGAPVRSVVAPAVTLAAPQTPGDAGAADAAPRPPSNAYPVKLQISLPARFDVVRAFEQSVPVTIVNEGDRPVRTLITAPTIGFSIQTPAGRTFRCGADEPATAIAERMTTLRPRGRTSMSIDIGAVCGTFLREPGLYRVRPLLDTRKTTPPPGDAPFWNGEAVGAPMLLRVRVGEDTLPRARLDPAPAASASK